MQFAVMYLPFAQGIFDSQPLGAGALALCLAARGIPLAGMELEKWLLRKCPVE